MKAPPYDVARYLLGQGQLFVQLDPRAQGVRVPEHLRSKTRVCLQFAYDMPVPIHDLEVSTHGISGHLSFAGVAHYVFVPWTAAFALCDETGKGIVYQENMPPEMDPSDLFAEEHTEPKRPRLTLIKGGKSEAPRGPHAPKGAA